MTTEELWNKFADCVAPRMAAESARAAFDTLQQIEALADANAIPTIADPAV